MSQSTDVTPAGLLTSALAEDPARPLITYYDDATGERTELSVATLGNWVAKTANLLVDGCGLAPGDTAVGLLPAHWQTAAVLLGCWSAGVATAHGAASDDPAPVDVVFAAADRTDEARRWPSDERYALALAPLAAPLRNVPAGFTDYVVEVRQYGDRFVPVEPADPDGPALVGAGADSRASRITGVGAFGTPGGPVSHRALGTAAADRAAALGLEPGGRLLVVDSPARPARPLDWLLAPLAANASVVLCRNTDPEKLPARAEQERVTTTV